MAAQDWMQFFIPDDLRDFERLAIYRDDFFCLNSDFWTDVSTGTGTAAVSSTGTGGILKLQTDASDNEVAGVRSTSAFIEPDPDEFATLALAFRYRFAEAATNAANIYVGLFGDTTTVDNVLAHDGGGPYATTHSGIGCCKVDGTTDWAVHSVIGAASGATTLTNQAAATGSAWKTMYLNIQRYSATGWGTLGAYADGTDNVRWPDPVPVLRTSGGSTLNIQKSTISTTNEMYLWILLKAGSGFAETLYVDYIWAGQIRPPDAISL